jgi:predicted phage terminase large subunit-like protein
VKKHIGNLTRRATQFLVAAVAYAANPASTINVPRMSALVSFDFAPGALEARDAALAKIEAAKQRGDTTNLTFREFVALVNPRYRFFKHCEVLGDVLQRVADGEISRLMIFMPPRHGKSEETSRLFSAYFLYRNPQKWVAITSYAADLAYTLSRAAKEHFINAGGELNGAAKAVKHWQTTSGGGMWATGVGGPATGKGWHLGIIDDPIKNSEQAASLKIREKQREWFQSVFSTREEPEGGALIFILTRWHEADLAGWQLEVEKGASEDEQQKWHIVNFAAIKEAPAEEPTFPASCVVEPDWREPGEALCPERYAVQKLKKIAKQVGEYFWNALFQQRPRPRDGGCFKRENLTKRFEVLPVGCRFVRYWDKAGTAGGGDWSAGVLMARDDDGLFYVVDVVRGQWGAKDREDIIKSTAEADVAAFGNNYTVWIEQEGGSGGKESAQGTLMNLAGYAVFAESVSHAGDKTTRARGLIAQVEAKNVLLKKDAAWLHEYIEELTGFPNANHDDQVDGSSGAFNKVALGIRWEWD